MKKIDKILLNLDSTIESQHALDSAVFLAKSCSATIVAVNIVNKNVVTNLARFSDKSIAEIEIELEENGWKYLYDAEEKAKNQEARIVIIQEYGFPEQTLPKLASEYKIDMIIIGQNPQIRKDVVQGKTAEQIIEHAPCAVLIVN
ncbi:universal stress protein [bacterium]|nr:universal stress protein [bacterium]